MSEDNVATWNWTSGRRSDGSVRAKMPPWLMPTAIGPVRAKAYCTPIANMRQGELRTSLVVIGLVQRNITRACR